MLISLIAAVAKNRVIGEKGKLPWNLPSDLKKFREINDNYGSNDFLIVTFTDVVNKKILSKNTFFSCRKIISKKISENIRVFSFFQ